MTRGFRAASVTLSSEDPVAYHEHLDAYLRRYSPVDKVEEDLVGLPDSSMWQVIEIEISGAVADKADAGFENLDEHGRLALAFKNDKGDHAPELEPVIESSSPEKPAPEPAGNNGEWSLMT